jgi:hypothetical protein
MTDQQRIDRISQAIALVRWARKIGEPGAIRQAEASLRAATNEALTDAAERKE